MVRSGMFFACYNLENEVGVKLDVMSKIYHFGGNSTLMKIIHIN
jgi:hypothetical protein